MSDLTRWTQAQREAITSGRRALLVSAAAGSGKTSVLADRCVHLVCHAEDRCDIDQLLVVTFTRSAAAEMRERIARRLREVSDANPTDTRLARQLRLIDRATICTLDAFNQTLLREHFVRAGIDADFRILDPKESTLLKSIAARDVVRAAYDSEQRDAVEQLLRITFSRREDSLIAALQSAGAMLSSVVDPDRWIDNALKRAVDPDTVRSSLQSLVTSLSERVDSLHARLIKVLHQTWPGELDKQIAYVRSYVAWLRQLADALRSHSINAAVRLVGSDDRPGRFNPPHKSKSPPEWEPFKKAVDAVRNKIKPDSQLNGSIKLLAVMTPEVQLETARRLEAFAYLLRAYRARFMDLKSRQNGLDFDDVAHAVLGLLRDRTSTDRPVPSDIAKSLHTRFAHVLVDECQDINPLQEAMLRLISTDAQAELDPSIVSNLFAVGDVKQSIYAFRMADPSGFVRRSKVLSAMPAERGGLIELNENFRSRPALLNGINTICERLMSADTCDIDYAKGHALSRGADAPESPSGFTGRPILFHYISDAESDSDHEVEDDTAPADDDLKDLEIAEREAQLIAVRIAHMMGLQDEPPRTIFDPQEKRTRPLRYSDIAILVRTARQRSSEIAGVLRRCGIPVHADDPSGFFNAIEVLDICSLIDVLDNSHRDIPLAALIRSPFLRIDHPEQFMVEVREQFKHLPFGEALHQAARGDSSLADRIRTHVLSPIRRWRELFRLLPVDLAIQSILDETGFVAFNAGLIDGEQRLANIQQLVDLARSFTSFERQGISRFAAFLKDLQEDAELPTPPQAGGPRDCVRVMTVHRAKGLEFPIVFLPLLGKKYNESSLRDPVLIDRNVGFGIKAYDASRHVVFPSPATIELKQSLKRAAIAEELRIFYVALTRAREHVELIATGKPVDRDSLIAQWASHEGPLQADTVLQESKLVSLLLAVDAIAHTQSPGTIHFQSWSPTHVAELLGDIKFSSRTTGHRSDSDLALIDRAIESIHWTYPDLPLTRIDSARSVTSLKAAESLPANIIDDRLARPRLVLSRDHVSALDRGSATHTVLQFIRPDALLSETHIASEIDRIIERRWLDPALRSAVDVDALLWLGSLDLHQLALKPGAELHREVPIYAAVAPEECATSDPLDQVLRRGRIDAMIVTADGVHVIDYKTDRISAEATAERASFYAPQIRAYAEAVSRWIARPVSTHLIFLTPRRVVTDV